MLDELWTNARLVTMQDGGLGLIALGVNGLAGKAGELRPGLPADFVLWEISQPAELCYWLGGSPPREVVRA